MLFMDHATTKTTAGRYFVKCDECRETMRFTDSVHESACGGRCEKCRAKIAAKYSPAARELAAYNADVYKAKRNARVAKKGGLR